MLFAQTLLANRLAVVLHLRRSRQGQGNHIAQSHPTRAARKEKTPRKSIRKTVLPISPSIHRRPPIQRMPHLIYSVHSRTEVYQLEREQRKLCRSFHLTPECMRTLKVIIRRVRPNGQLNRFHTQTKDMPRSRDCVHPIHGIVKSPAVAGLFRKAACSCLAVIMLSSMAASAAHADVHIRVKNCSDYPVKFMTFDGADWLDAVPYKVGTVSGRHTSEADASPKRTACSSGEFCKIDIIPQNFDIEVKKRLKIGAGKYLRITRIDRKYAPSDNPTMDNREKSYPVIGYTIDAREKRCPNS